MTWLFYIVWPAMSTYFKITFRLWKFPEKKNLPKGGKIFASNHCSNAEGAILNLLWYKPVRFLGKSELFEHPIQRIAMKGVGTIPIKRGRSDKEGFQHAVIALKAGHNVGIFPEGTRGDGKTLLPPHTGVIRLALLASVPIIPVGISGANKAWPRGKIFPIFRKKVWMKIGDPWYVPEPPEGHEYTYEELKALSDELMTGKIEPLIDWSKS